MLNYPCQVLLIEDEPEDINSIQTMLSNVQSAFFGQGFKVTLAETLAEAQKTLLSQQQFDVILLDLMLPDSRYTNSLKKLQQLALDVPIIVQTALEDEVVVVKALELGACGYLPKLTSDRNLLMYAIRTAIERKQQLASLETSQQLQQDRELDSLERLLAEAPSINQYNEELLSQRVPDIFTEITERYLQLLDNFVEQQVYKTEYSISEQLNILTEQLGYLQANPSDIIQIHTKVLKQKQTSLSSQKNKIFMVEGRYLLLKLMSKLVAYYRRYYIGLNKINLAQDYYKTFSPER